MINKAEAMKEEDAKKRDMVDLKNEADTTIHSTQKSLDEHRSKLSAADIEEIEKEITALRTMTTESNNDVEGMKEQIQKVKDAAMKIGKAMYSNTGGDQSQEQS